MDRWIVGVAFTSFLVGLAAFGLLWAVYPDAACGALDGVLGGVLGVARP
jgi:hypothetical protein